MGTKKKQKMKIFAVFTIFAVNSERIKCWVGEGRSIDEFNENASKVTCGENDLCQMTVRKRGGVVKKIAGKCKQERACKNNSKQNFRGRPENFQCRPEDTLDDQGAKVVSVCRSCSDAPWEQRNSAEWTTEALWRRYLLW